MQLVVTRNIFFPVVLGIDFLQTHGGITSFPTSQLYLTNSSPKPADQSINANHIYNTYTPPMHAPKPYHPHSCITVPAKPYHVINTEPVSIPAGADSMMTIPCALFRSGNSLLKLLKQHFADQPVESTPVINNAKNDNSPVHCMDHSDHEVVTHKHSYAEAMDDTQEPDQDILPTKISSEPVSQHALSTCLAYSDLLPEITPSPQNNSIETSPNPTPKPKNLFTEPPATDDTILVESILPTNFRNTTSDQAENLAEINPLPDLAESQRQQEKMQCIYKIDNPHDINTLLDCMTNHEKQRANPSVEKETPVNNHTLSNRTTNRSTQTVARSRESNNFANNLDQQETRNENTSPDTRQTLANGSNIYLVEQMEKHRHRMEKLEFLIKWLGFLNHPNTWKPEDHLPPALVPECFQQSLLENPTRTNAVLPTCGLPTLPAASKQESLLDAYTHANYNDYTNSRCIPRSLSFQTSIWKAGRVLCFT